MIYLSDLALAALLVITLAGSIIIALTERRAGPVLAGLALIALQAVIIFSHFWFLFWTVD